MSRGTMKVKNGLEVVLHPLGLYNVTVDMMQRSLKFHPVTLYRNYHLRRRGAPDGLPIPPGALTRMVVGHYDAQRFLNTTTPQVMRQLLIRNGFDISQFEAILDFGCGCGRIMRHWVGLENVELHGSDISAQLVRWCQQNLPFAEFYVNELTPPLRYADNKFDFAYAYSVFTHLPEDLQIAWMRELGRVLVSGGFLIISTHGEFYLRRLDSEEQRAFLNGDPVVKYPRSAGSNFCNAYHPYEYIRDELAEGFDIVDFLPGGGESGKEQDLYLLQRR